MTLLKSLPLAAGLLVAGIGTASAVPAIVATDLNLRAGPGTQHGIITSMPAGATVNVGACQAGWCTVNYAGRTGFASSGYLDMAAVAPPRRFAAVPQRRFAAVPQRGRVFAGPAPRRWADRRWHPHYGWYDPRFASPGITLRFGDRGFARFGW